MDSGLFHALRKWALALAIAVALFYAMDQILMSAQGLPLDWNLSPQN